MLPLAHCFDDDHHHYHYFSPGPTTITPLLILKFKPHSLEFSWYFKNPFYQNALPEVYHSFIFLIKRKKLTIAWKKLLSIRAQVRSGDQWVMLQCHSIEYIAQITIFNLENFARHISFLSTASPSLTRSKWLQSCREWGGDLVLVACRQLLLLGCVSYYHWFLLLINPIWWNSYAGSVGPISVAGWECGQD